MIERAKFDFVLALVSNVVNDRFELAGFNRPFEPIVDVDSIAENRTSLIQRTWNPMEEETSRVAFGYVSTKRRVQVGIMLQSRRIGDRMALGNTILRRSSDHASRLLLWVRCRVNGSPILVCVAAAIDSPRRDDLYRVDEPDVLLHT